MTIKVKTHQYYRLLSNTCIALFSAATLPLMLPTIAQAQTNPFTDVPATHWAKNYIETLEEMEIISDFPDGSFLPDESVTRAQFATLINKAFLSGSPTADSPETSQALNAPTQEPYRVPPQPTAWTEMPVATFPVVTKRIGLSRNGERLITLSEKNELDGIDHSESDRSEAKKVFAIQVWDVRTGELITEKVPDDTGWFSAIAISEDGQKIAAIFTAMPDDEMELMVWDLAEAASDSDSIRQPLGTVSPPPTQPPEQLTDAFTTTQVAFRPGSNDILTQVNLGENNIDSNNIESSIRLHNNETGEVLHKLTPSAGAVLTQFAFSPDGTLLAARGITRRTTRETTSAETVDTSSSLVDLWQLENGERFATIRADSGTDFSLVGIGFTETGAFRVLEQSYTEAHLNTWNLQINELIEQLEGFNAIDRQDSFYAFSSDGVHMLVSGTVAGTRMVNTQTQKVTRLVIGTTGFSNSVFSPDGRYLAVATLDNVQVFSNVE